ncbi:hypothetical protein FNV43_RR13304 [Rhamnella rubrinervis]|uniref:Transmembrane protein n=1 Tax=Rhamnella rubrinervis TaxID=2594499 RepID=A0A8K0MDZ8_9ROSA|nr:hypothetical protein FNV43_RR13304 [Rhamnella rubrinervis]
MAVVFHTLAARPAMATLDSDVPMVPVGEASSSAGPSSTKKPKRFEIKSGTPSLSGPGILLLITALFAGTILWISVLSAKLTKLAPRAKSVRLLGNYHKACF